MTPENKRSRAKLIREHAASYPPLVAATLIEIADDLEAEAARQEEEARVQLSAGPNARHA